MSHAATWGVVSTIKAPAQAILDFAAHHLDLGAHRLHLYLDEPNPEVFPHLKAHPKIRVTTCDDQHWSRRKTARPKKHQVRQTLNATHAYGRIQTDWIAHIDVDEFLCPQPVGSDGLADPLPLGQMLAALPPEQMATRVRPIEALPDRTGCFKAMVPRGPERIRKTREIYPRYGHHLAGGFLSHTAGKVIARTGLPDIEFRIHNLFQNGIVCPTTPELTGVDLCHFHAPSWDSWQKLHSFRLRRGSYRAELKPSVLGKRDAINTHDLLTQIIAESGDDGLRSFYDELHAVDSQVFDRLQAAGLIRHRSLDLNRKRRKHFPGFD
ncbi:glycosyltransferase family 2 protein [Phaeobacter sp.]|uniref:glycosyltransferase family 2 protein n=1 Tax=Phaeobacter sp. TaxID=1902409 RepID=UPI0025D0B2DB|nr:glycosyltransferase family 2 protein [Phaeobacter sp.]